MFFLHCTVIRRFSLMFPIRIRIQVDSGSGFRQDKRFKKGENEEIKFLRALGKASLWALKYFIEGVCQHRKLSVQ